MPRKWMKCSCDMVQGMTTRIVAAHMKHTLSKLMSTVAIMWTIFLLFGITEETFVSYLIANDYIYQENKAN